MLTRLVPVAVACSLFVGCAHDSPARATQAPPPASAYLEITLKVDPANRAAAAAVYTKYRQPFLDTVPGALSKQLLVRDEDVVVLHGFDSTQHASAYLTSALFTNDVVVALKPVLAGAPDVRIYAAP
jgi:hypothetical protein